MVRLSVLFALLTGCHQAFGVDAPPPVCGPFAAPTPVAFDASLANLRELSVAPSGTEGIVVGEYMGNQERPHAIKLADGVWSVDDARDTWAELIAGASMVESDTAFGWSYANGTAGELREYKFNAIWATQVTIVDNDPNYDKRAGNAIAVPLTASTTLRLLVETVLPLEGQPRLEIRRQRIDNNVPGPWEPTGLLDELSRARLATTGGVLTADGARLVYAAAGDDGVSHLFASAAELDDSFEPGSHIELAGIASSAHVTEPWINADCSTIYFNRDGEIMTATALDDPQAGQ